MYEQYPKTLYLFCFRCQKKTLHELVAINEEEGKLAYECFECHLIKIVEESFIRELIKNENQS